MNAFDDDAVAVLLGASHPGYGRVTVSSVGASLAAATSAGAVAKARPPLEPNEDAAAVACGARADLLVVADAHHGSAAARLAVEHVLEVLGADPPPADLSDDELTAIAYDAGRAVADWTSVAGSPQRASRTTLAFALVTESLLQWSAFGDSHVVAGDRRAMASLAVPRTTYLGDGFVAAEVAALLQRGRVRRRPGDAVVLATDGLCAGRPLLPEEAVAQALSHGDGASACARRLVDDALAAGVSDAVTVSVAISPAPGRA